jgi:hypothetical protein
MPIMPRVAVAAIVRISVSDARIHCNSSSLIFVHSSLSPHPAEPRTSTVSFTSFSRASKPSIFAR